MIHNDMIISVSDLRGQMDLDYDHFALDGLDLEAARSDSFVIVSWPELVQHSPGFDSDASYRGLFDTFKEAREYSPEADLYMNSLGFLKGDEFDVELKKMKEENND